MVDQAFDPEAGDDGSGHRAGLGKAWGKLDPGSDPWTFGKSRLVALLESIRGKYEPTGLPPTTPGPVVVRLRTTDKR